MPFTRAVIPLQTVPTSLLSVNVPLFTLDLPCTRVDPQSTLKPTRVDDELPRVDPKLVNTDLLSAMKLTKVDAALPRVDKQLSITHHDIYLPTISQQTSTTITDTKTTPKPPLACTGTRAIVGKAFKSVKKKTVYFSEPAPTIYVETTANTG